VSGAISVTRNHGQGMSPTHLSTGRGMAGGFKGVNRHRAGVGGRRRGGERKFRLPPKPIGNCAEVDEGKGSENRVKDCWERSRRTSMAVKRILAGSQWGTAGKLKELLPKLLME